jgi:hypothetical protein
MKSCVAYAMPIQKTGADCPGSEHTGPVDVRGRQRRFSLQIADHCFGLTYDGERFEGAGQRD